MNVDPMVHSQVLETKLSALTIREALLEAAVQQLTLENAQHGMEIERLQAIISPPVPEDEVEDESLIRDNDEVAIEVTE